MAEGGQRSTTEEEMRTEGQGECKVVPKPGVLFMNAYTEYSKSSYSSWPGVSSVKMNKR